MNKLLNYYLLLGSDRYVADPLYTRNFEETHRDILQGCSALKKYIYLNYDIED